MEVLVRHDAHFQFPSSSSRDRIASFLASCLQRVDATSLWKVTRDLISLVDIKRAEIELRKVLLALVWMDYTHEALTLILLLLFSRHCSPQKALAIFEPWMQQFDANIVTKKLLMDALSI